MPPSGPRWRGPLVAVAAVSAAFALRWSLRSVIGATDAPLQMFFLAVFVAAWAGGLITGLVATLLSVVVAYSAFFRHPDGILSLASPDVFRISVFLLIGTVFSVLSESRLRALEREARQRVRLQEEQERRAAALSAAAAQREQLQRVIDQVPVILANCGPDRRFKFVNKANADRFGLTPAQMVGRKIEDVLGAELSSEIEPYIQRVLAGERVEYEMTYSFPATGHQRMQCTYVPERDPDGQVVGWIAALVNVTPMRQAEADVKNFAFLVQNTSDFIGMSDLQFRPIYLNAAAARISGVDPSEIGRASLLDFFFAEDRPLLERELFPSALREGHAETEIRIRHQRTGDPMWMACNVVLLRDPYGNPSGYATIGRDLTERKRKEDQLREASRLKDESIAALRHIADSMPQIIWSAGPDGRVDYYNRRWYELLGAEAPPSPEPGGDWQPALHPDDRGPSHDLWMASVRNGTPFEMEYRLEFPGVDGYRWYLGRALPLLDDAGAVVRWYGTSTDIHDRKMVESELAESRARLRAALDASVTGTFRWDIVTNVLESDTNLDRLFGLSSGTSARSLPEFFRMVHPDDRARVVDACRRCADTGADFEEEFRVVWPDGTVRWLFDKGKTVLDTDGRPRTMAGACVDVTERREKEEALRAADRQKDEFLGMLAHELRNPLAPIIYSVAALERQMPAPEARRPLEIIARQTRRMTRIVDDLLDVSRVTQGKISLQRERLDVAGIVGNAADVSRAAMDARGHRFEVRVPGTPLPVSGDAVRLGQVFENLLSNAAKYTPPGGDVTVTVERDGPNAVVRVRDTGVGISPDVLPRIFDLFVQADTTLDRSEGGLGIGLTLVERLTRMHGGGVEARSEGPGLGAEFMVRLPLEPDATAVGHHAGDDESGAVRRRRYLIVDDNVDSAESLRLLLEMRGHAAHVVHDGRFAAAAAREFEPDIVLLDIGLPGMDGYQVVRQFRAAPDLATLMIVATTGYGRVEDKLRCLAAGFDQHIAKPLDVEDIEALESAG
jgi:PAS domain S-box-containing protein